MAIEVTAFLNNSSNNLIGTKAGESGKIFGAVTAVQIADVLKAKGFDIDRKKVIMKESPKELGSLVETKYG